MKRVVFNTRANAEVAAILKGYAEESWRAGTNFANAMAIAVRHIQKFPKAWSPFYENYRKFILKPFPYALAFRERGGVY